MSQEQTASTSNAEYPYGSGPRVALALAGGGARGLAHIGVLQVLEREGIPIHGVAATSMGGVIGALYARGLHPVEIAGVASEFRFPRWFVPGGLVRWEQIFPSAVPMLSGLSFEQLRVWLAVTAVDLEAGTQVVLHSGPVLPAIQATCAVPGVLPPVNIGGRWLVDGGLMNVLPVDVAWMTEPDFVIAVKAGDRHPRRMPELNWRLTSLLSRLGLVFPNPATAKMSFDVLVRAVEISLDRQQEITKAMTDPEVVFERVLGDILMGDFERLDVAVAAGKRAAQAALPEVKRLLQSAPGPLPRSERVLSLRFDPVCAMVISPGRARAALVHRGKTYYFCSENCRDNFARDPDRYLRAPAIAFRRDRRKPGATDIPGGVSP